MTPGCTCCRWVGTRTPRASTPSSVPWRESRRRRSTHHGPALNAEERRCRAGLERLTEELGVGRRVSLEGPVPRSRVPALLARADALVNNMRMGAPDKVVYEAAATCLPVFASNPIFEDLLPRGAPVPPPRRRSPRRPVSASSRRSTAGPSAAGSASRSNGTTRSITGRTASSTWSHEATGPPDGPECRTLRARLYAP